MCGQKLAILFERKRAEDRLYVCEGGPLGTLGLPTSWTSFGPPAAERPLTVEVLIELAALMAAIRNERPRPGVDTSAQEV